MTDIYTTTNILKVIFLILTYFTAAGILLTISAIIANHFYSSKKSITVTRDHNKIQYIPKRAA